jgi:DNA-directed RNA polymerase specialized sigma24 family protein
MAAQAAHDRGEDFRAVGVRVYFDTLREWPSIVAGMTIDAVEWERVRLDAICDLGGWAATGLTLEMMADGERNERLIDSLASDGRAPYRTMLERLATSALLGWDSYRSAFRAAWDSCRAGSTKPRKKPSLRNRISGELEAEARQQKKVRRADGGYTPVFSEPLSRMGDDVPSPYDLETFVLAEEARQAILSLLTPREAEFWRLDDEGYSDAEIAQAMGVKIGTVGATLAHVRAKIKKARAAS